MLPPLLASEYTFLAVMPDALTDAPLELSVERVVPLK